MSGVYAWLIQNAAMPLALSPTRSRAASMTRDIRRRQRWPLDRMRMWQLDRVKKLVRLAETESPFYRDRFARHGVSSDRLTRLDDLAQFPVTTKSDLQSNFPDGIVVASRRTPDWQYIGTRGTTHRVIVVKDFRRRDIGRAAEWVAMTADSPYSMGNKQLSIPPDACSTHCGIENERASTVVGHLFQLATRKRQWDRESASDLRGLVMENWLQRTHSLPPLPSDHDDQTLANYVDQIRRYRPVQLLGLPEYLMALSRYITRTGDAPPAVEVIRPIGANIPISWKQPIEQALGGVLREHYGSREMGPMAFDCAQRQGMHVFSDSHYIEVVKNGRPVREGEVGQVLVTDLFNLSMPIIRYQIGDLATITYEPCECGRRTPRLSMHGRIDDGFVRPSGNVITAETVSNFISTVPGVIDYQLEEKSASSFRLRVVAEPESRLDPDELSSRLQSVLGDRPTVVTKLVRTIRPESSGKFRHTKSRSFGSFDSSVVDDSAFAETRVSGAGVDVSTNSQT